MDVNNVWICSLTFGVPGTWLLFASSVGGFSIKDFVIEEFGFFVCEFNEYGFVLLIKLRGNCIFLSSWIFDDDDDVGDASTIFVNVELLLLIGVVEGTDDNWSVEQLSIKIEGVGAGGGGGGGSNGWGRTWIVDDWVSKYEKKNEDRNCFSFEAQRKHALLKMD